MKRFFLILLSAACLAAAYKPVTLRQQAQYLSTEASKVEDTCPGQDIFQPFSCSAATPSGYTCFDVYRVQGDPIPNERYTQLDQTISVEASSAEPLCPFEELTCENFLSSLKYNLDFSWFISNFPSSSFPQCGETYSCTRIACLRPLPALPDGTPQAQKLSCVFKKNQTFFLGAQVTCQNKKSASAK